MHPKVRTVLAVVAGYFLMVVIVIGSLGLAWMVLGADGAFAGEGPYPSAGWLAFSVIGGFIAAILGGFLARHLGGSAAAVKGLVGLVLVLGLISALTGGGSKGKNPVADQAVAEMSWGEAGQHAQQPTWYNWLIPLVGAAGVVLGGRRD